MMGDQVRLSNINEKNTSYKVELGDKTTYPVEGFGQASIKMKTGNYVHLSNVLYVPGLEKNHVSISCLEDKGNRIAFVDGKVLSWHKDSSIENARVIGSHEGNLYRLLVGMFYRQRMLVIDGKYNNDDGLSTGRM
jgi:hypothetical protein